MSVASVTVQGIYGVSVLSSAVLAYVIWRHRDRTGAGALLAAILAGVWWAGSLFLAASVADPALSVGLAKSAYVGVVVAVAAIFLFALAYTGREHLVNRRAIGLLAIEPAIVLVLVAVNPGDVFFAAVDVAPAAPTGVDLDFGPAFYVHTVYSYVLVFATGGLILDMLYRTRALYRGQFLALGTAVFLPLVANFVAVAGVVDFDTTPVGFVVANALYTVAIVRYRLIDLVPIARDRLVNNVNDAMYVVDTDDRIVDVNPAGERLARAYVDDVDLLGRDARDLLEMLPEVAEIYEEVVATSADRHVEFTFDGRHFLAEANPIDDAQDRTVGWLFVIRDITDRKEREQQLRRRNEQLDKFASVVSHDLRNPLQVAAGRVELASETGDTTYLAEVEDALQRMEAIIDDVLSLARGGTDVTDRRPLSIRAVAEDAWDNVETAGADLSVTTDVRVQADRDRFERLLENLFRNAVEHGSRGDAGADAVERADTEGEPAAGTADDGLIVRNGDGRIEPVAGGAAPVTVEVGFFENDESGIYVADDGPGIPAGEREQIFESGYSTAEEGTGFGLTIVSQIAGAHGWAVRATGSESGGARFELTGVDRAGA